jgi:hypothetical protein
VATGRPDHFVATGHALLALIVAAIGGIACRAFFEHKARDSNGVPGQT